MKTGTSASTVGQQWSTMLRPRFEGCNVGTWIGFKHIMYLCEEAVIAYFRDLGLGPAALLADCGLSLELRNMRLRLREGVRIDDEIRVALTPEDGKTDTGALGFRVRLYRGAGSDAPLAASGSVGVICCALFNNFGQETHIPPLLEGKTHQNLAAGRGLRTLRLPAGAAFEDICGKLQSSGKSSFVWKWRIPYFYCHDTYRLQYSGFIRVMEEVVDLFLADKGISIGAMLRTKSWIPVVTEARIDLLADALLEETLYTVYEVEDVVKDIFYTASMRCFVHRDDELIQVAEGRISHAYVEIAEREVGTAIATFDERVLAAFGVGSGKNGE